MDAYVQIVGYAVWPLTVLAIAGALRVELIALIRRITSIETKGLKAGLSVAEIEPPAGEATGDVDGSAESNDIAVEAQPVDKENEPAEKPPASLYPVTVSFTEWTEAAYQTKRAVRDVLLRVARDSPRAAIDQAWIEVRMAVRDVQRRFLTQLPASSLLVGHLDKSVRMPRPMGPRYDRLNKIRQDAQRNGGGNIEFGTASRYIALALPLADDIRYAGNKLPRDEP